MIEFRWNEWNVEHIDEHNVRPFDAEQIVRAARRPFPEYRGDGKWRVIGQTNTGRYLQVVYVVEADDVVYVVHARDLTDIEKHRYRRRRR